MREEFEKLPDIKRKMAMLIKYDADSEMYKYMGVSIDEFYAAKLNFINGAWYAYQEQQKKINFLNMKLEANKCVSSKRREEVLCRDSKINAAKKEINDFFDNQTMTPSPREYANKLADVLELLK